MMDTTTTRRRSSRRRRNVRRSSRQQTDRSSRRPRPRQEDPNPFQNNDGSWDRGEIMRYAHSFAADMHFPDAYSDRLGEALTVTWEMAKEWPRGKYRDPKIHADQLQREAHAYEEDDDGVEYLEPEILRENAWSPAEHEVNEYYPAVPDFQRERTRVHVYDKRLKRREDFFSGERTWHVEAERGVEKQNHVIEIEYMTLTLTLRTTSSAAAVEAWTTLTEMRVNKLWSLLHSCRPDNIFNKRAKQEGWKRQQDVAAMLESRLGDCSVEFDGIVVL